MDKKLQLLYQ